MRTSEPKKPQDFERIPLVEEQARVEVKDKHTSTVRVSTHTSTDQDWVTAEVLRESVQVTTVPVGQLVEKAPDIRTEGDLTIVPVLEEVVIVEKRLFLREEIHIKRHTTTEVVTEPVMLRSQQVSIERIDETKENSQ